MHASRAGGCGLSSAEGRLRCGKQVCRHWRAQHEHPELSASPPRRRRQRGARRRCRGTQNSLLARGRAPSRRGTPCRDGALPSPGAITEWTSGARTGKGRSMGCARTVQGAVTRLTVVAPSSGGVRRTSALGHSQRSSSTSPCEVHADGLRRRPLRSLGRGEPGHAIDTRTLQLVGPASRPRSRADQPRLVSEDHGLDAAAELEFAEDAADVGLDRALLQEELGGDLGVALALGDQE